MPKSPYERIQEATARNTEKLSKLSFQYQQEKEQTEQAAIKQLRDANTQIAESNETLTPFSELHTPWGQTKQSLAALMEVGVPKAGNYLVNTPQNMLANRLEEQVPEEFRDIAVRQKLFEDYNREESRLQNNKNLSANQRKLRLAALNQARQKITAPTEEELSQLYQTRDNFRDRDARARNEQINYGKLMDKVFENRQDIKYRSESTENFMESFDLKNEMDTSQENLRETLGEVYSEHQEEILNAEKDIEKGNITDGILGALPSMIELAAKGIEKAAENPGAIGQFFGESGVQTLLMLHPISRATGVAANAGYGLDTYRENLDKFQKENGRSATDSEMNKMFAINMAVSALETGGDLAMAGALKGAAKSFAKTKNLSKALKGVSKAGAKGKKTANSIQRAATALTKRGALGAGILARGYAVEAGTESAQTYIEEHAGQLKDGTIADTVGKDIFTAGTIGGVIGGAISSPNAAAKTLIGSKTADQRAAEKEQRRLNGEQEVQRQFLSRVPTQEFTDQQDFETKLQTFAATQSQQEQTEDTEENQEVDYIQAGQGILGLMKNENITPDQFKEAKKQLAIMELVTLGNQEIELRNKIEEAEADNKPAEEIQSLTKQLGKVSVQKAEIAQLNELATQLAPPTESTNNQATDASQEASNESVTETDTNIANNKQNVSEGSVGISETNAIENAENTQITKNTNDNVNTDVVVSDSAPESTVTITEESDIDQDIQAVTDLIQSRTPKLDDGTSASDTNQNRNNDQGTSDPEVKALGMRITNKIVKDPARVSDTAFKQLIDSDIFTSTQRQYLDNIRKSKITQENLNKTAAGKNTKEVGAEIVNGSDRNKGIGTYQNEFTRALETEQPQAMSNVTESVRKWAQYHKSKAMDFKQAATDFREGNFNSDAINKVESKYKRANGGNYKVDPGFISVANTVEKESELLDALHSEFSNRTELLKESPEILKESGNKNVSVENKSVNRAITTNNVVDTSNSNSSISTNESNKPQSSVDTATNASSDIDTSGNPITTSNNQSTFVSNKSSSPKVKRNKYEVQKNKDLKPATTKEEIDSVLRSYPGGQLVIRTQDSKGNVRENTVKLSNNVEEISFNPSFQTQNNGKTSRTKTPAISVKTRSGKTFNARIKDIVPVNETGNVRTDPGLYADIMQHISKLSPEEIEQNLRSSSTQNFSQKEEEFEIPAPTEQESLVPQQSETPDTFTQAEANTDKSAEFEPEEEGEFEIPPLPDDIDNESFSENLEDLLSLAAETQGQPLSTTPSTNQQASNNAIEQNVEQGTEQGESVSTDSGNNTGDIQAIKSVDTELVSPQPVIIREKLMQALPDRIKGFFTIKGLEEDSEGSINPLTTQDNFIEIIQEALNTNNNEVIEGYLGRTVTKFDQGLLNLVPKYHAILKNYVKNQVKEYENVTFKKGNPSEMRVFMGKGFFTQLNENGETVINDNAITALTASVLQWVATEAGSTLHNSEKEVKAILGLSKHVPAPQLFQHFYNKGVPKNKIIDMIGKSTLSHLNVIESNKNTVPGNAKDILATDIGLLGLGALTQNDTNNGLGLLVEHRTTFGRIKHLSPKNQKTLQKEYPPFVDGHNSRENSLEYVTYRAISNADNELLPEIITISDAVSNAPKLFKEMFKSDVAEKSVISFEPVKEVVQKLRGTNQRINKRVRAIIAKEQASAWQPNTLSEDLEVFSEDNRLRLHKYDKGVEERTIKGLLPTVKGKNIQALNSYRNFVKAINRMKEQDKDSFYFKWFLARQTRAQIENTDINPHVHKEHRFLIRKKSWLREIDPTNIKDVQQLYLGLVEAFDMDRDKKVNKQSISELTELLSSEKFKNVLNNYNNRSEFDSQNKVVDWATQFDEPMHAMAGLSTYAKYQEALDNNTTFKTDLMPEIDGITNGPMIGLMQFGLSNIDTTINMLQKGGIYFNQDGKGVVNHAEWLSHEGNADAYKTTSNTVKNHLQESYDPNNQIDNTILKYLDSVYVDPESQEIIVTRSFGKDPTITTVYGAGETSLNNSLTALIIESMQESINATYQEVIKKGSLSTKNMEAVNQVLQDYVNMGGNPRQRFVNKKNYLSNLPEIALTANEQIADNVAHRLGVSLQRGINDIYEYFMHKRQIFNELVNKVNTHFINAYENRIAQKYQELTQEGIIKEGEELPKSYTDAIQNELRGIMPIINTPYSNKSQLTEEGLWFGELTSANKPNSGSLIQKRRMKFTEGRDAFVINEDGFRVEQAGQQSVNSLGATTTHKEFEKELGVKASIMAIHMLDATVALETMDRADVMSIFDGFGYKLGNEVEGAKQTNQSFHRLMKNYSIFQEGFNLLNRVDAFLDNENILTRGDRWTVNLDGQSVDIKLVYTTLNAQINRDKNAITSADAAYNQYYVENGVYYTNSEESFNSKENQNQGINTESFAPINRLLADMGIDPAQNTANVTADTVINTLQNYSQFKGTKLIDQFYFKILSQFKINKGLKAILDNTNIQVLQTQEAVLEAAESLDPISKEVLLKAPAMFLPASKNQKGNGTIYIKGPKVTNEGNIVESFLHEMIHAVTSNVVGSNKNLSKREREFKDNINAMRGIIQDRVNNTSSLPRIDRHILEYAAQDSNEFIAMVLTNETVQKYLNTPLTQEEISKLGNKYDNKVLKNTFAGQLVSMFKRFLTGLRTLFTNNEIETEFDNMLERSIFYAGSIVDIGSKIEGRKKENNPPALGMRGENVRGNTSKLTHKEIFNKLGEQSPNLPSEEISHMESVLATLEQGINSMDATAYNERRGVYDSVDSYLKNVEEGKVPFVSSVIESGLPLSKQQQFVFEQIEAATSVGIANNIDSRKRLQQVFKTLDKELDVNTLVNKTGLSQQEAQQLRDYIFNPQLTTNEQVSSPIASRGFNNNTRSDYLSRLLAVYHVYKPFRDAVKGIDVAMSTPKYGRLSELLDSVIGLIAKTFGNWKLGKGTRTARQELEQALINTSSVKANYQSYIINRGLRNSPISQDFVRNNVTKLKEAIGDYSARALDSKYTAVRRVAAPTYLLAKDKIDDFVKFMEKSLEPLRPYKAGIGTNIINEVRGSTTESQKLHDLLLHRKDLIDKGTRITKESTMNFVNNDLFKRKLSEKESINVNKVLIETDIDVLLDNYSVKDIGELVLNQNKLNKEIQNNIIMLEEYDSKLIKDIINRAKYLGYFMATYENKFEGNLDTNAHTMANRYASSINKADIPAFTQLLDQLTSLYAVKYTHGDRKQNIAEVIKTENARTDANGIEGILLLHKEIKKEALDKNFDGNPMLMRKGFTNTLSDEDVGLRWINKSTMDNETKLDLKRRGYREVHALEKDTSIDSEPPVSLFISSHDGLPEWVTGIASRTTIHSSGTDVEVSNIIKAKRIKESVDTQLAGRVLPEPYVVDEQYPVPIYDAVGNVSSYRYMMSKQNKDTYLHRRNEIGEVLGSMRASIANKNISKDINGKMLSALKDQYTEDLQAGHGPTMVTVGPNSPDPELRELFYALPPETRHKAHQLFPKGDIQLRRDYVNLVFGYRMPDFTKIWDLPKDQRNLTSLLLTDFFDFVSDVTGLPAIKGLKIVGKGWEETVRAVKNIWVIKNLFTLTGNTISNTTALWARGVPLSQVVKQQYRGYKLINEYQHDQRELLNKQHQLNILENSQTPNPSKVKSLQDRIVILKDNLSTNDISELVDAGIFQTIIEDIDVDNDPAYSYKDKAFNWMDQKTKFIPDTVKNGLGQVLLTQNSKGYKALNHLTQISDLVARYALYGDLTQRRQVDKKTAVDDIMKTFIHYDIPTDPYIEWANRKGILWFTKYYLRIISPLLNMMRENPGKIIALLGLEQVMDITSILDSAPSIDGLANRVGDLGAMMTAPLDIATLQPFQ